MHRLTEQMAMKIYDFWAWSYDHTFGPLVRKRQDRPSRERKLDGRGEARLIALACSSPPSGRGAWTLQLLADKLVELQVVDTIADETVRQVLKKTSSSRG